ncbi:nuclear transport factor 2 family protein [Deinococcus marmoris]|uniref:Isomerase n=1 Tax=Deinococcus marmoris TaxID=249408 RepID=A0A1U7P527_9DEIO|nr:nuclear transport factor 2 family protein [Deinococcus marmoris]OLV20272.1 isomerase [Deinococcus marmoris]
MDHHELVQQYIAVWNETDAECHLALVKAVLTGDATYADPRMTAQGQQGISDMIGVVQTHLPGLRFSLAERPVEAHHGYLRFSWLMGPVGGASVSGGTDIIELRGGLLGRVIGFVDFPTPVD